MDLRTVTGVAFVTQVVDPEDAILGSSARLASALARRCEPFIVIANEVRSIPPELDGMVVSLGKEHGAGKVLRGLRYARALCGVSRRSGFDSLLAHMCPVYVNLASPVTRLLGVRSMLWWAHPSRSWSLRLAERLSTVLLTSLPEAFPPGPGARRVIPVGQAIDTGAYRYIEPIPRTGALRLLSLGRTSPSKGYGTILRGVAEARAGGVEMRLRIVGPSATRAESDHRRHLLEMVARLDLHGVVSVEEAVQHSEVIRLLDWCDALVNATAPGSGDKVVFEAMAVGRLVLVSNPAFDSVLAPSPGSTFADGDASQLAARIEALASMSVTDRAELGRQLRSVVEEEHSLHHWVDKIVELSSGPAPADAFRARVK